MPRRPALAAERRGLREVPCGPCTHVHDGCDADPRGLVAMQKRPTAPAASIDEYIAGFPAAVQDRLRALRATVQEQAPEATERMSYGMPTFYLNGNLVHFAAFAHHIGFYPTPTGITAFHDALARYKSAKGSVQFPHAEPLPLELVAAMVRFRVAESMKAPAKHPRKSRPAG